MLILMLSNLFKKKNSASLEFTFEDPDANGYLQFLDLGLESTPTGLCWGYKQRKSKSMLSNSSNHSKIIKNAMISNVFRNSVMKSCCHNFEFAAEIQLNRIIDWILCVYCLRTTVQIDQSIHE